MSTYAQIIYTIAGNGSSANSGEGVPATDAAIGYTGGCAFDHKGNLYFSNGNSHNSIKKIDRYGYITTVAGTGSGGYNGDNIPATNATLNSPTTVAFDSLDNLYIADGDNQRVRRVDAVTSLITTVAGNGIGASTGDGYPATNASIYGVEDICFDHFGNLYILEYSGHRIRKVTTSGIIATIAGTGISAHTGDGGPATAASLSNPVGICLDAFDNLFVSELGLKIRRIDRTSKLITTIAGIDSGGISATGDGGPATQAAINPRGIAIDAVGNLFVAGYSYGDVRRIDNSGIIRTVAGTGVTGYSGDGGVATNAKISALYNITLDSCDNLYISDRVNCRIRKVALNPACWPVEEPIVPISTNLIFPNPVIDDLTVQLSCSTRYRLYGALGKILDFGTLSPGTNKLSFRLFINGLYFLELTDDEGRRRVHKIIKQ